MKFVRDGSAHRRGVRDGELAVEGWTQSLDSLTRLTVAKNEVQREKRAAQRNYRMGMENLAKQYGMKPYELRALMKAAKQARRSGKAVIELDGRQWVIMQSPSSHDTR